MLYGIWPDRISGLGDIGDGSAGGEEVENRQIIAKITFHGLFSTLNPISAISKVLESSFVEKWEKIVARALLFAPHVATKLPRHTKCPIVKEHRCECNFDPQIYV